MENEKTGVSSPSAPSEGGLLSPDLRVFMSRLLVTLGIVGGAVLLLLFFLQVIRIVLFVFGGILVALLWRGLAHRVSDHTPLGIRWSLTVVGVTLVGGLVGLGWALAPQLSEQFQNITQEIPRALEQLYRAIQQHPVGQLIIAQLPEDPERMISNLDPLMGRLGSAVATTAGGIVEIFVLLFVAVHLAIFPEPYLAGIIRLAPPDRRGRVREVLAALGSQLQWWLVARALTMIAVGLLTLVGLWLLDVPMALTLAIIAGILEFIPYVGPILSSIPAILLALLESPLLAVYVALFYWFVQSVESYLISPILHQKIVSLAPALVIIAELVMAVMLGFLGLILASPLLVVVAVLIKLVYRQDILGESPEEIGKVATDVGQIPSST